jgi:hypothetical protein
MERMAPTVISRSAAEAAEAETPTMRAPAGTGATAELPVEEEAALAADRQGPGQAVRAVVENVVSTTNEELR